MKAEISYTKTITETITVPKEWEFYFTKDEEEYTDKEWDIFENKPFLNLPYDNVENVEVNSVYKLPNKCMYCNIIEDEED